LTLVVKKMSFRKAFFSLESAAFLAVLLFFLPSALAGREDPADEPKAAVPGPRCPYCHTTGKIPNPFYEEYKDLEKNVLFCSYAIEKDKVGHGLPWIPCPHCKNKVLQKKAQVEFAAKVKVLMNWLAERRKIDALLKVKKPLLHLQTKHFVWAWNIPRFKGVDKKIYNMHRGLHLYAERMERFYSDWQRVYGVTDADNVNNLHQIFCFERRLVAMRACPRFTDIASRNGKASKQGDPSVYVTWWDRSKCPTDEDFHSELIHNVNHLLTAVYKNHWWLHKCGVAYEGGSHWWEIYYFGRARTRCFVEADSSSGWRDSKWQTLVKKAVLADRQPRLADIITEPGTSLKASEHPFAWSYIDYMMPIDPKKVLKFYLVIKEKRPPREAFMEAFGMSIHGFESKWEEYVLKNYNVQDDAPAVPKRFRRKG